MWQTVKLRGIPLEKIETSRFGRNLSPKRSFQKSRLLDNQPVKQQKEGDSKP
jgi:hypothetical protein